MPIVSVVVPVFKVENVLHYCIDSILNQTYKDFELILVDDGSPDNSGKICDDRLIIVPKCVMILLKGFSYNGCT